MKVSDVNKSTNLPHSVMAWQLIKSYLARRGHCLETMQELPADLQKELMTAASMYASLRLAEIEAGSKFRQKIHIKF